MKSSYLLKTLLAVAILGTSYLPDAYAAFSFGELNGYGDVTMNASDVGQSFTTNWLCSANFVFCFLLIIYVCFSLSFWSLVFDLAWIL